VKPCPIISGVDGDEGKCFQGSPQEGLITQSSRVEDPKGSQGMNWFGVLTPSAPLLQYHLPHRLSWEFINLIPLHLRP